MRTWSTVAWVIGNYVVAGVEVSASKSGLISIPIGKYDAEQDMNLLQTGLREVREEVGVEMNPDKITWLPQQMLWDHPSKAETHEIIFLHYFMDPDELDNRSTNLNPAHHPLTDINYYSMNSIANRGTAHVIQELPRMIAWLKTREPCEAHGRPSCTWGCTTMRLTILVSELINWAWRIAAAFSPCSLSKVMCIYKQLCGTEELPDLKPGISPATEKLLKEQTQLISKCNREVSAKNHKIVVLEAQLAMAKKQQDAHAIVSAAIAPSPAPVVNYVAPAPAVVQQNPQFARRSLQVAVAPGYVEDARVFCSIRP